MGVSPLWGKGCGIFGGRLTRRGKKKTSFHAGLALGGITRVQSCDGQSRELTAGAPQNLTLPTPKCDPSATSKSTRHPPSCRRSAPAPQPPRSPFCRRPVTEVAPLQRGW